MIWSYQVYSELFYSMAVSLSSCEVINSLSEKEPNHTVPTLLLSATCQEKQVFEFCPDVAVENQINIYLTMYLQRTIQFSAICNWAKELNPNTDADVQPQKGSPQIRNNLGILLQLPSLLWNGSAQFKTKAPKAWFEAKIRDIEEHSFFHALAGICYVYSRFCHHY